MRVLLIGIGAAGNKAVVQAINDKVVSEEDSIIINSTDKDFPKEFNGKKVPDILYTGNHTAIEKYRRKESLRLTKEHRPDLFEKHELTKQDKKLLDELKQGEENPKWMTQALEKGKKFTK